MSASVDWRRSRNLNRLHPRRLNLQRLLLILFLIASARVLVLIVAEYGSYFPANFDSAFLTGRRNIFRGLYRTAFYVHIVIGPLVLVLGFFLMFSGLRQRYRSTHRRLGWIHVVLVAGLLCPSGLVMATQAYTGPIAGWGFATQSIATCATAIATAWFAVRRSIVAHKTWATRCFILLCSPLLLRTMSGMVIVLGIESEWTYRLSAWTSWILPCAVYELWRRLTKNSHDHRNTQAQQESG